jgi:hypothetical protein
MWRCDVANDDGDERSWAPHDHFPATIASAAGAVKANYSHGVDRPLGTYAALVTGYLTAGSALGLLAKKRNAPALVLSGGDLALATVATAWLGRTLAKDPITSFLRAPFTRFKGRAGEAELAEEVCGSGPRHGIGELLTCPFCLGPWVGGALVAGATLAPRATRAVTYIAVVAAGADVAQYGFAGLQQAWKRSSQGDDQNGQGGDEG